jgi:hypothetical protein
VRLLDTRSGLGVAPGAVGPAGVRDLQVVDGSRVPADATAVVLNVTATAPTAASTDVRVYPTPAADDVPPTVSSLNLGAGATVANLVTVAVGAGGQVRMRNALGSTHLVADLAGYYTGSGTGSSLATGSPDRILDTRREGGPLRAGEVRRLQVVGTAGVPAGTTAVVLNVTGVGATARTDVRVYPTRDGAAPVVSNLNPSPGRTTAASVVVPVGADGSISLRNNAGRVDLVVDLLGRYTAGAAASVVRAGGTGAPARHARRRGCRSARAASRPGWSRAPARCRRQARPSSSTSRVAPTAPSTDVRVYPTRATGRSRARATSTPARAGRSPTRCSPRGSRRPHPPAQRARRGAPRRRPRRLVRPVRRGLGRQLAAVHRRRLDASRLPVGGAFAVVGLTRGRPLTSNECFAAQWAWAETLPGEPAVYLNVNAPGDRPTPGRPALGALCGAGQATSACGRAYGVELAAYALDRMPLVSRHGGRPMVWMDVEGPYTNGPVLADRLRRRGRRQPGGARGRRRHAARRGPPRRASTPTAAAARPTTGATSWATTA